MSERTTVEIIAGLRRQSPFSVDGGWAHEAANRLEDFDRLRVKFPSAWPILEQMMKDAKEMTG